MKIILRIILILLVASAVAAAFSLAVNNNSIASGPGEGEQPPAMTNADGQDFQPMDRPEGGDHEGGSLAGGIGGVLATLAKLSIITVFVLLIQKAFNLIGNRRLISSHQ